MADLSRRLLLRLLPDSHLAAGIEALADRSPSRDMDCRRHPRDCPDGSFPRHLHARA
jgi:hypothetical protein